MTGRYAKREPGAAELLEMNFDMKCNILNMALKK